MKMLKFRLDKTNVISYYTNIISFSERGIIFMLQTTIEHVTQISFLPRLFPINVYLVEESDGITLIDAGMSFSQRESCKQQPL